MAVKRVASAATLKTPDRATDDVCPTCKQPGHKIEDCEQNEELKFQRHVNDVRLMGNVKTGVYNPGGEGKTLKTRLHRNLKTLREILKDE